MEYPDKQIQYIEFTTNDLATIRTFYEAAFDWKFTEWSDEYWSFDGENVSGGFFLGEVVKGSILPVIYTKDLEASLEQVKAAGAEVVRDTFSFPGGRRFHYVDPDGNELAVCTYETTE